MARNGVMKAGLFALVGSVVCLVVPGTASAGTATGSMAVSATVANNCTIASPSGFSFGSYDPVVANAATNLDVTSSALTVACTKGAAATITLDGGQNAVGAQRYMKAGSNTLNYEIYTAAARTTIWNTANSVSYTSAGKAAATVPVYGRIASGQDVPSGSYADSITATINF